MSLLEKLNPRPGIASNAMCTFLAINTSSVQLIPTTAIGILAIAGSKNPTAIVGTAFLATCCAAIMGVTSAKLLAKLPAFRLDREPLSAPVTEAAAREASKLAEEFRAKPSADADMAILFANLIGVLSEMGRIDEASSAARERMSMFKLMRVL